MEKISQRYLLKWGLISSIIFIMNIGMYTTEWSILFLPFAIYLIWKIYKMKINENKV
jgi:hypothetical protein